MDSLERFQQAIGYTFGDQSLLVLALTHRSRGHRNNERLEYLGDSILGFVISEALYMRFPKLSEGDLTKMRSRLVRGRTLAARARNLNIREVVLLGGGELKSGGSDRDSILADTLEAVFGAAYLDGGFDVAKNLILTVFSELLDTIGPESLKDAKTLLQEMLQKNNLPLPVYEVIKQSGEPHKLVFTVTCTIRDLNRSFTAAGRSRKLAEQAAAGKAIESLA